MSQKNPSLVLQPRDIDILRAIYEHRFLTRALILPLFGSDAGADDTNLDRRLRKLTDARYVRRLPRENRRTDYVYALTATGADLLERHQVRLPFSDWSEKNRTVRTLFVEHTLMVARVHVSFVVGLRELTSVTLEHYERESRPRGHYALVRSWRSERGVIRKVNPDALLILGGVHPGAHFLEADQSTMAHSRMAEKFEDYAAMYREKRHPELFGVESFRVCVVTKSEERSANLMNLLIEGSDVAAEERRLFWFASEEAFRNPRNILATIWKRADEPALTRALVGSPLSLQL